MDKWLYRASVALVILGLLVSIYMTIYKFTGDDGMCLGSGDCHTVNASKYSEVNGIPVAIFGIGGYLAILAVLYFENSNRLFKQSHLPILCYFAGRDDHHFHPCRRAPDQTTPILGGSVNAPY